MPERLSDPQGKIYQDLQSSIQYRRELENMDPREKMELEIEGLNNELKSRSRFNIPLTTLTVSEMALSIGLIASSIDPNSFAQGFGSVGVLLGALYGFYTISSLGQAASIKSDLYEKIRGLVKFDLESQEKKKKRELVLGDDGELVSPETEEDSEFLPSITLDELTEGKKSSS